MTMKYHVMDILRYETDFDTMSYVTAARICFPDAMVFQHVFLMGIEQSKIYMTNPRQFLGGIQRAREESDKLTNRFAKDDCPLDPINDHQLRS